MVTLRRVQRSVAYPARTRHAGVQMPPLPARIDPPLAAQLLANWGFLVDPDLPDHPGPAHLLVAIRRRPTLAHYDPELIEYWTTDERGYGIRASLTHGSRLPLETDFSWGPIVIVDRLGVSNTYITFGGRLAAARIDDAAIFVFRSPAPLLRTGGHSQGWDPAATNVGGFFGRVRAAAGYEHGLEETVAAADPMARYAAFVRQMVARFRASEWLRDHDLKLWTLLLNEERRLRERYSQAWADGERLLRAIGEASRTTIDLRI
jgi:hypothetical protein